MRFGIIGLGRIGGNLARQAIEHGHEVVGHTPDTTQLSALSQEGVIPAGSPEELVSLLDATRLVLIYVPQGRPVDEVLAGLRPRLDAGDVVVDGGNSRWTDAPRRARALAEVGARFLDMGTSGGLEGARRGACFMVGGDRDGFDLARPLLVDLAATPDAVVHVGETGEGHFVKMVHNAVEFGMLQAIGEGVELLVRSRRELDVAQLLRTWTHGSVIRGWLLELLAEALSDDPQALDELSTCVDDTGEVKWVVEWALEHDVPAPVVMLSQSMLMQYRDAHREPATPMAKAVALMRHGFGGHPLASPDRG